MGLLSSVSMFADPQKRDELGRSEIREDVSREDIVAAFRSAMIGHIRSHIPGTNINESTLLASDYLNHFHELVMLLEAVSTDPKGFADDLLGWRPLTYEQHFSASGFRDKTLAIAAYRRAPPKIRARFDEAVAKLHAEAITVIAEVATELKGRNKRRLHQACEEGVARLRVLIDAANRIATGESTDDRVDPFADVGPQDAIDALFNGR
jgi:hypothetical protein